MLIPVITPHGRLLGTCDIADLWPTDEKVRAIVVPRGIDPEAYLPNWIPFYV